MEAQPNLQVGSPTPQS